MDTNDSPVRLIAAMVLAATIASTDIRERAAGHRDPGVNARTDSSWVTDSNCGDAKRSRDCVTRADQIDRRQPGGKTRERLSSRSSTAPE